MNRAKRRERERFKKYVKTSDKIYGNGKVYFCDGDSVVGLREENFDFESLRPPMQESFWSRVA
jgi:hypothetical protein